MVSSEFYIYPLAALGVLVLFFFLLDVVWSLLQVSRAILAPFFIPNEETSLVKKYGPWALVTGSTDGIGKAYAIELGHRGLNIVLVSRNEQKLKATASEIEQQCSVKTHIIVADFSEGYKAVEKVKKELGKLEIDILVNNVGKQYEYPMYLNEVPEQELADIINVNVGAVTLMTRALIDDMKKRGRGAIVNVSSGSELQPLPLLTVYAATKSYIKSFTAALRYEYANSGITIQHLAPMFINTKMNHFSNRLQKSSTFVPSASSYAKYAVSTLGKMDESTGYWSHGIQYFFTKIPPVWIRMYIGGYMNQTFRKDYFREREQVKSE
ncbi:inactive hydroxysteroid dehydrogenase-like protein 1 [Aethina tumida]|uniref:inactive hydroxysteroid dehydrogenase-like protein 1 n=1 Tax=Aethina tumida TaxID=116153 RepID=UPI002148308C|nr:inactive hydroxysteroid dehydrogenase-like protein 1 [Aethina tumida]XP_049822591.1 inactive hydroxysteroid dehydrogenase-like protein 1 [Aethina tumida]XP_049822592.1 inactive hydroxysteroid dehydrogenase-like protein 1 [Aethina tumida]